MIHPRFATLSRYLDGELSPGRAARVEAHLAACEVCRAKVALLRAAGRAIADEVKEEVKGADGKHAARMNAIGDAVMAHVRQNPRDARVPNRSHTSSPEDIAMKPNRNPFQQWGWATAAMAVCVAVLAVPAIHHSLVPQTRAKPGGVKADRRSLVSKPAEIPRRAGGEAELRREPANKSAAADVNPPDVNLKGADVPQQQIAALPAAPALSTPETIPTETSAASVGAARQDLPQLGTSVVLGNRPEDIKLNVGAIAVPTEAKSETTDRMGLSGGSGGQAAKKAGLDDVKAQAEPMADLGDPISVAAPAPAAKPAEAGAALEKDKAGKAEANAAQLDFAVNGLVQAHAMQAQAEAETAQVKERARATKQTLAKALEAYSVESSSFKNGQESKTRDAELARLNRAYEPTNGTVSAGDVVRIDESRASTVTISTGFTDGQHGTVTYKNSDGHHTAPTIAGVPSTIVIGDMEPGTTKPHDFVHPTNLDLLKSQQEDSNAAYRARFRFPGGGRAKVSRVMADQQSLGDHDGDIELIVSDGSTVGEHRLINVYGAAEESFREEYDAIEENRFLDSMLNPLSTFSIDVDTASYSNIRRMLTAGQRPPAGSVRIEECLNYFHYDYPAPTGGAPFSVSVDFAACPWNKDHRLARVGLKGKEIDMAKRGAANLVFLIDVSGSMNQPNKLPLVKQSLKMLANQLRADDRVAIVTYAGAAGVPLDSTRCSDLPSILSAIDGLGAGGGTNGAAGIVTAYQLAATNFVAGGVNRVILATDGDWNIGVTNQSELDDMIKDKAKSGVYLSVLGFGMGNYNDSTLEKLADKGNGNYAYIDTPREAQKALVEQIGGTLVTIAKDVKIQVEFNPAEVVGYRLLGYENRIMAKEDFNDDKKDAGEIGSGISVTALYELVPPGAPLPADMQRGTVDGLKYQTNNPTANGKAEELGKVLTPAAVSGETMTVKLRYKEPNAGESGAADAPSKLLSFPAADKGASMEQASDDFRFAAAVAEFGLLLRNSQYKGAAAFDKDLELAQSGVGRDEAGYRAEFVDLLKKAAAIIPPEPARTPSADEAPDASTDASTDAAHGGGVLESDGNTSSGQATDSNRMKTSDDRF